MKFLKDHSDVSKYTVDNVKGYLSLGLIVVAEAKLREAMAMQNICKAK